MNARNTQRGFALIAALFVMVVLAMLGIVAMRNSEMQTFAQELELLSTNAREAAAFGIEWAAVSITTPARCLAANPSAPLSPQGSLSGFTVTVTCSRSSNHVAEGTTSFEVSSTATFGRYGTPTFVSRTITTRLPS